MSQQYQFCLQKSIDLTDLHIEGERILLVSISPKYAQNIFLEFDSTITRYMMPKPADAIEETYTFIADAVAGMSKQEDLVLVILNAHTKEFLGCCGFHGRNACNTPELGIWLKKSAHGHKYGREAITTLCNWAVNNIKFDYAIYPVDEANIASRKIPEALGGVVFATDTVIAMTGNQLNEVIYKLPFNVLVNNLS